MIAVCEGVIVTAPGGGPECQTAEGAPLAWVAHGYPFELDLSLAAEPFFAGFALVAMFWALGKGVALVLRVVR